MPRSVAMKNSLRETPAGLERGETTQPAPGAKQMGFSFEQKKRVQDDQDLLALAFRDALKVAGGSEWLAHVLDRPPSYESKINDGIAGRDGRTVQLDWFAPLLDDREAIYLFVARVCDRAGMEPPVWRRTVESADVAEAAREVIAEIKDEEQRELFKKRVAKKLGVRVEDVKL